MHATMLGSEKPIMTGDSPACPAPPVQGPLMSIIISIFSWVPTAIYLVVALLLSVVAVISLYDAVLLIVQLPGVGVVNFADGITQVIKALLLTITVIVLFETVTVYFRTKHVQARSLIVAGLTGTIRQILVLNYSAAETFQLFALVGIMAVLIAGIVLVKPEDV
jgi:uncharacterized membrane protein (DUF373 family)